MSDRRRRRSAVLDGLERLRRVDDGLNFSAMLAYFYICENEGLNITELAQVSGLSLATASRAARALVAAGDPFALAPAVGLVELRGGLLDQRWRLLYLTEAGRRLRAEIDAGILAGATLAAA